ncbi:MAG: Sec-independent protein translocase protein TatB [Hyphomicrobiaceae bacterium]
MLDIGWSELFIVATIALLVVGPKELPSLLRTIGRFAATIKRQAQEFRTQFDEAIKDTEFEQVKKEFDDLKSGAESTIRDASASFEDEMRELDDIRRDVDEDLNKAIKDESRGSDAEPLDEPGDWRDEHNAAILEAEKTAASNGDGSHESRDKTAAEEVAPDAADSAEPIQQSAKAGAAT